MPPLLPPPPSSASLQVPSNWCNECAMCKLCPWFVPPFKGHPSFDQAFHQASSTIASPRLGIPQIPSLIRGSEDSESAEELEQQEEEVLEEGKLYLPANSLAALTLATKLQDRLCQMSPKNLSIYQQKALTEWYAHLPSLIRAKIQTGKAPFDIGYVASILDRLLFGGLLGLTESYSSSASPSSLCCSSSGGEELGITRVIWASQKSDRRSCHGFTTRDSKTLVDSSAFDAFNATKEKEILSTAAAPGDIQANLARQMRRLKFIESDSYADDRNRDNQRQKTSPAAVLIVVYVPYNINDGLDFFYTSRHPLKPYLLTLLHEMVHALFVAYGCLCVECQCQELNKVGLRSHGHGEPWKMVMRAAQGAVERLLGLEGGFGRDYDTCESLWTFLFGV